MNVQDIQGIDEEMPDEMSVKDLEFSKSLLLSVACFIVGLAVVFVCRV